MVSARVCMLLSSSSWKPTILSTGRSPGGEENHWRSCLNLIVRDGLYSHSMIWSPRVPVFRDDVSLALVEKVILTNQSNLKTFDFL